MSERRKPQKHSPTLHVPLQTKDNFCTCPKTAVCPVPGCAGGATRAHGVPAGAQHKAACLHSITAHSFVYDVTVEGGESLGGEALSQIMSPGMRSRSIRYGRSWLHRPDLGKLLEDFCFPKRLKNKFKNENPIECLLEGKAGGGCSNSEWSEWSDRNRKRCRRTRHRKRA